jgi:Uma2 family endonuclease
MSANAALLETSTQKKDKSFISLEKYFQEEEKALYKSEYHKGKIIKMAGGTFNHDNLAIKAAKLLDNFVEDNNFDYLVNGSDTKIRIEEYDRVVYAYALVICAKPIYYNNRKDTITNPIIIVEVLSENSTAEYDRTQKFDFYRSLESFKEYILIKQERKQVSVFTKQKDATWVLRDYHGEDATAILYSLHECPLPLKRLYRGLELE